MIKQTWNIDSEEKMRILNLHESATKNLYLLKEQSNVINNPITTTTQNTFPSVNLGSLFGYGQFKSEEVKNQIKNLKPQIESFMKTNDSNSFTVNISAGESQVTNPPQFNEKGSLGLARANSVKQYFEEIFPEQIKSGVLKIKSPTSTSEVSIGKTQYKRGYQNNKSYSVLYNKEQFVKFDIVGSGESKKTESGGEKKDCDFGFSIILEYKQEWCKPGVDESKCHKCDNAIFNMWANGIPLTNKSGDPNINLNNDEGNGKSGPSRKFNIFVSQEQKKEILEQNPEEIVITYNCATSDCHSDPAHVEIINEKGNTLLKPTFITTGGKRMSNKNTPVTLLKLNKCGEVIFKAGESSINTDSKPKVKEFRFEFDENNNIKPESLYQIYQYVKDGVISLPKDKLDTFRYFQKFNGKPWQVLIDDYRITKRALKRFNEYVQSLKNQ